MLLPLLFLLPLLLLLTLLLLMFLLPFASELLLWSPCSGVPHYCWRPDCCWCLFCCWLPLFLASLLLLASPDVPVYMYNMQWCNVYSVRQGLVSLVALVTSWWRHIILQAAESPQQPMQAEGPRELEAAQHCRNRHRSDIYLLLTAKLHTLIWLYQTSAGLRENKRICSTWKKYGFTAKFTC